MKSFVIGALLISVSAVSPAFSATMLEEAVGQYGAWEQAKVFSKGQNMPLALAVRKIAGYEVKVVFSPSVPVGKLVSWTEGQSRKDQLDGLLSGADSAWRRDGNMVHVTTLAEAAAAEAEKAGLVRQSIMSEPVQIADRAEPGWAPPSIVAAVKGETPEGEGKPVAGEPSSSLTGGMTEATTVPETAQNDVPPAPVVETVPEKPKEVWPIMAGMTLRRLMELWTQRAGYTLAWQRKEDNRILADARVEGEFDEAVRQVFEALSHVKPPVEYVLYPSNKVLVVKNRETGL